MERSNDFHETKCVVCGKPLCILDPSRWSYKQPKKKGYNYYCSYSCFRHAPEKPKRGRQTGHGEEIIELLRQGKTQGEIMKKLGCSVYTVNYWRARMK
ncbi:MAG: helix-turn-helix domain-containing protein [Oscillospiraceae bacterium]|nr:helix-turn-helix domain-containing protein [Oscillospiraceae bacterium]